MGALLQQVALSSSQESSQHLPYSQSLFDLDQALYEANEVLKKKKERLLEECVKHASSQLCLHLGIALLRSGKQSRLGWREHVKQAQPLLLLAAVPRVEVTPIVSKKEAVQKRIKAWEIEKANCRSQAGHVILAMAKEGVSQFLNRINQFCCPGWREKLYQVRKLLDSTTLYIFILLILWTYLKDGISYLFCSTVALYLITL